MFIDIDNPTSLDGEHRPVLKTRPARKSGQTSAGIATKQSLYQGTMRATIGCPVLRLSVKKRYDTKDLGHKACFCPLGAGMSIPDWKCMSSTCPVLFIFLAQGDNDLQEMACR